MIRTIEIIQRVNPAHSLTSGSILDDADPAFADAVMALQHEAASLRDRYHPSRRAVVMVQDGLLPFKDVSWRSVVEGTIKSVWRPRQWFALDNVYRAVRPYYLMFPNNHFPDDKVRQTVGYMAKEGKLTRISDGLFMRP